MASLVNNKSLDGHTVLFLSQDAPVPSQAYIDKLQKKFPGLKCIQSKSFVPGSSEIQERQISDDDFSQATILVGQGGLPLPEQTPNLQYLQTYFAGANPILDTPLFLKTNAQFCTANGVHGPQISEWVISTWISFQHHFATYLKNQQEEYWEKVEIPTDDAVGRRVGILGYGGIGRQVARVATAMGSEVYAYTFSSRDTPESRHDDSYYPTGLGDPEGILPAKWFSGTTREELHKFLDVGLDLLVICVPLTDKTRHMIAAPEFKLLAKRRTFISNVARGAVVKTDDLVDALNNDVIRGAAIDVTDPEPLPKGHPLWKAKNAIVMPHVSGNSTSYDERVLAILERNLERLSEGKPLINVVNRKEGY